jgi:hypothetical protein
MPRRSAWLRFPTNDVLAGTYGFSFSAKYH